MTIRRLLSARSTPNEVARLLRGLVHAAVYMGRADGAFRESEVEALIDSVREAIGAAPGEEALKALASVPQLLDWAREARRLLNTQAEAAFLEQLSQTFHATTRHDALLVAYRIIASDGSILPEEAAAFRRLASALGLSGSEVEAIESLAQATAI